MGFLKKITRPISRALDKIIPNEVKPALPFLAAAAPFMAPGLMGLGGNTMLSRALMSGGLNLGAQLAQEGSEGDFSGLSTLMAAATGALSTPGSAGGRTLPDGSGGSYSQVMGGDKLASTGTQSAGDFFRDKAAGMDPGFAKSGLGALETSSNYLSGVSDTLQNELFSKEGLKAALIPAGQGMTDLAVAENRRAMRDYERELADYEASIGDSSDMGNRALAIRQSMEAYGFPEDEILAAIEAAGYANGGRVGFEFGGIPAAVESVEEKPKEFLVDKLKVTVQPGQSEQMAIMNAMMNDIDEVMPEDRKMEFYKLYLPQLRASGEISENEYQGLMGELFGEGKAEGGIMDLGGREMDMRTGGFIPIGKKERADDVPARLSKNEFVMTADAVRAAGGGSVNEGARRMYNLMNNLEAKV
jgi:hypothetical protein